MMFVAAGAIPILVTLLWTGLSKASYGTGHRSLQMRECSQQAWPYIDVKCLPSQPSPQHTATIRLISTDKNAPAKIMRGGPSLPPRQSHPERERELFVAPAEYSESSPVRDSSAQAIANIVDDGRSDSNSPTDRISNNLAIVRVQRGTNVVEYKVPKSNGRY